MGPSWRINWARDATIGPDPQVLLGRRSGWTGSGEAAPAGATTKVQRIAATTDKLSVVRPDNRLSISDLIDMAGSSFDGDHLTVLGGPVAQARIRFGRRLLSIRNGSGGTVEKYRPRDKIGEADPIHSGSDGEATADAEHIA
jgi:hypothetical protein